MDKQDLKKIFGNVVILDYEYPKPYPAIVEDPAKVKAIVLGCDPSNFSDNGKTRELEYVFGIEGRNRDGRYFAGIKSNLKEIGISMDEIYVQNLCRNYFNVETANNTEWMKAAKMWRTTLKQELDDLIDLSVPVFITSEKLYFALINDAERTYKPIELYSNPDLIPLKNNFLNRPLIPLYRHYKYSMANNFDYAKHIKQILNKTANAK